MPRMLCSISISSADVKDIYESFDVAVCEVDDRFKSFSGTRSENIQNAAGPNLQLFLEVARNRVSGNVEEAANMAAYGYAVNTPVHLSFASNLLHVVRPHCSSPPTVEERYNVRATYANIFQFASKMGYRNIMIPLLGSNDKITAMTALQAVLDCTLSKFVHIMIADSECAGLRRLQEAFASLPGQPSKLTIVNKKMAVDIRVLLCDPIVQLPSATTARKLLKFTELIHITEGQMQLIIAPCKQNTNPVNDKADIVAWRKLLSEQRASAHRKTNEEKDKASLTAAKKTESAEHTERRKKLNKQESCIGNAGEIRSPAEQTPRTELQVESDYYTTKTATDKTHLAATKLAARNTSSKPLGKAKKFIIPEATKNYVKNPTFLAPQAFHLGERKECEWCSALTYTKNCCNNGTVYIRRLQPCPPELRDLLMGTDKHAENFRQHITKYNTSFAMGSLQYDRADLPKKTAPFVKVQGSIRHLLGSFRAPLDKDGRQKLPIFGQTYTYVPDEAVDFRLNNGLFGSKLDKRNVKILSEMFSRINYLAKQYRTLQEIIDDPQFKYMPIRNFCLVLRAPTEVELDAYTHQGTLSRPKQELASFLFRSTEGTDAPPKNCVWVCMKEKKKMTCLAYFNPILDPLCYPLIFPFGEKGYQTLDQPLRKRGVPNKGEEPNVSETADDCVEIEEEHDEYTGPLTNAPEKMTQRVRSPVTFLDDSSDEEQGNDNETLHCIQAQSEDKFNDDGGVEFREEQQHEEESEALNLQQGYDDHKVTYATRSRKYASRREYMLYVLQQHRRYNEDEFHPVFNTLMVGQLWIVDQALRMIRQQHDNARKHTAELLGTDENTVHTYRFRYEQAKLEKKNFALGYMFRVSPTVPGSVSWYRKQSEDAMAVIYKEGKPDLFITITGNPEWDEITSNLLPHTKWQDMAPLCNDVFFVKSQHILKDIRDGQLFGPVTAMTYSVEFQKRGMPHMHLLVTLQEGHKLDTPDKIDSVVWARIPELPDKCDERYEEMLNLKRLVSNIMMHRPCQGDDTAYCNQRKPSNRTYTRCTKFFPKPFGEFTSINEEGKVDYYRPDDGERAFYATKKKGFVDKENPMASNQYVVPYSPHLLAKYKAHINVEVVSKVGVVKYIYKYIFKGYDKALVQFVEMASMDDGSATGLPTSKDIHGAAAVPSGVAINDKTMQKISERIKAEMKKMGVKQEGKNVVAFDEAVITECFRQMTANEAVWRIQGFPLSGNSHIVKSLPVHEPNCNFICFRKNKLDTMMQMASIEDYKSQLKGWFKVVLSERNLPESQQLAKTLTYQELGLYYRYVTSTGTWVRYVRRPKRMVVRVRPVNPRQMEKFAIRLLAMHQRGSTSFESLRTVNGTIYETFGEAARMLGLMNSDIEFRLAMQEAAAKDLPKQLRRLFADILTHGAPSDPFGLWEEFKAELVDRLYEKTSVHGQAAALYHLQKMISYHGKTLEDFHLPDLSSWLGTAGKAQIELNIHIRNDSLQADLDLIMAQLRKNPEQQRAFDVIAAAVMDRSRGNCFFLEGSGGCGKTFVYKALYHYLRARDVSVQMIATTGIAATLLDNGTTAHRFFMLPLNMTENGRSLMKLESKAARDLRELDVVILDEATMASRFVFRAIDTLLQEVMETERPFGGKIMLLGGDWKQLLPVVTGESSDAAVQHTLKADEDLWGEFQILSLTKNVRTATDDTYARFLENIGNGRDNGVVSTRVILCTSDSVAMCEDEVVDFVYNATTLGDRRQLARSCLLTTLNVEATEFNERVLDMVEGATRTYTSVDTPAEGMGMQVPPEYYHDMMETGMPPHLLRLKVGAVVILLRNLNIHRGMCNGTRMEVIEMHDHYLVCRLLTTKFAGKMAWIAKAKMTPPNDNPKRAKYERLQFPIRLAYAMTINKSQGQTFDAVGVILRNNVFAHGQLYVALSRARGSSNVRVYSAAAGGPMKGTKGKIVVLYNKVHREVLEQLSQEAEQALVSSLPMPSPPIPVVQPKRNQPAIVKMPPPTVSAKKAKKEKVTRAKPTTSRPPVRLAIPIVAAPSSSSHVLFINEGTDCFVSTALQCLRVMEHFVTDLVRSEPREGSLASEIVKYMTGRGELHPGQLRTHPAINTSFRTFMGDVSEFVDHVISNLPEVHGLFTFVAQTTYTCRAERHSRTMIAESLMLQLGITAALEDTLVDFQQLVTNSEEVYRRCPECQERGVTTTIAHTVTTTVTHTGNRYLAIHVAIDAGPDMRRGYHLASLDRIELMECTWKVVAFAEYHHAIQHYTAWTRSPSGNGWVHHNDAQVPPAPCVPFYTAGGSHTPRYVGQSSIDMHDVTALFLERID